MSPTTLFRNKNKFIFEIKKITQSSKYEKRNFWRVQIKKHIKVDQIFADRNFRQTMGRERERERIMPLMKY